MSVFTAENTIGYNLAELVQLNEASQLICDALNVSPNDARYLIEAVMQDLDQVDSQEIVRAVLKDRHS